MIAARSFAHTDVGVFGLARTGLASIRALKAAGARAYAWDDSETGRRQAAAEGAIVLPVAQWPWARLKALVLSPGVPLTHPAPHDVVLMAKSHGVEVIGDMEIFAREVGADPAIPGRAPVIAITGTNGKSTTTALVGHILSQNGFDVQVGGNIGKAVLDLEPPEPKTIYVLELSSYQIDLAPGLVPDVSVLSNITPDHIDRHGSLENYAAVKARLLAQTSKAGQIVIGVDDALTSAIFTHHAGNGTAVPVSVGKVLGRGVFVVDGTLYDAQGQRATKVMDLSAAAHLPGAHNWQNAALAFAATKPYVRDSRAIAQSIADFPRPCTPHGGSRPHRVRPLRQRLQGDQCRRRGAGTGLLSRHLLDRRRQGQGRRYREPSGVFPPVSARPISSAMRPLPSPRRWAARSRMNASGTLDLAVRAAAADAAQSGLPAPVVLLSPACASFDQFRDFEQRGEVFRAIVADLRAHPVREAS
ncbi:MAG: Mur ligase family protein [Rhizomicrobium sp.]